jgi:hypothetical protein
MTREAQLYKAAIIAGLIAKEGISIIDEETGNLNGINTRALYLCGTPEPIEDRDNTVAPARILISDERLRQLKIGFTLEYDQAQGLHLLNKAHIRFKKVINKKRTELRADKGLAIEHEIDEMVKVCAMLAAYVDVLLTVRKTLQK